MDNTHFYLPREVNAVVSRLLSTSVKCVHLNATSVKNKVFPLEEMFAEFNLLFSAIMLTETWCTNDQDVFRLEHYKTFYLNRINARGGGVAVLVKENIECQLMERYCLMPSDFEVLTLHVDKVVFLSGTAHRTAALLSS